MVEVGWEDVEEQTTKGGECTCRRIPAIVIKVVESGAAYTNG
jgi:hypothetical protein